MSYKDMMDYFKRDAKQEFKKGGTSLNMRHVKNVSQAVCQFPSMLKRLEGVNGSNRDQLSKAMKGKQLTVASKLVWLELNDRDKLKDMLNSCIFNKPDTEMDMASHIHSQEEALNMAVYLGILDDYYDYLESGVYNGPTARL